MNFNQIKKIVKQECKKNNITFYHGRGATVKYNDNIRCNGYFTDNMYHESKKPRLAVSSGSNALDVLIHEYCHMQQYLEQSKEWLDLDGKDQIWDWINGNDSFTEQELDDSTKAHYLIELDCEKRSILKHIEWNTGLNIEQYIQKANSYILFYIFMRDNRVWYKAGSEPYNLEEVWSIMPKTFTFDHEHWYNDNHKIFNLCI